MSQQQTTRKVVEATYIPQARRVLTAQYLKGKAIDDEIAAKRACASAMNTVSVREFEFNVPDGPTKGRYRAELKRPTVQVMDPVKLYVLVKEQEISVEDFLECVKIDEQAVKDLVGESRAASLYEPQKKGLNLILTPL